MKEITSNVIELEDKIGKLSNLKTECEAINVSEKKLVGGGSSIDVLHGADVEYMAIKTAIITLLDNSVAFFTNVKTSLEEADRKAAEKLNLEASRG